MTMKQWILLSSTFGLWLLASLSFAESLIKMEMELVRGGETISEPTLVMDQDGGSFSQGMESDELIIRYELKPNDITEEGFGLDLRYSFERIGSGTIEEDNRDLQFVWGATEVVRLDYPDASDAEDADLILNLTASEITQAELDRLRQ